MRDSHEVGDKFIEYAYSLCDTGIYNHDEWLIWQIESINHKGMYKCVCIKDCFHTDSQSNLDTYVHFYYTNYKEWIEAGSMRDYEENHFSEELFTL